MSLCIIATNHAARDLEGGAAPCECIHCSDTCNCVETVRQLMRFRTIQREVKDYLADRDRDPSTLLAMLKAPEGEVVRCHICGQPATCIGAYEGMKEALAACDDCCGHACEDGRCDPIVEDP